MKGAKEFTGRSLDDAIAAACKYYDLPREKLEVEIINDAKTGIFGLVGAKKATILAKQALVKNFDFEAKEEKNRDHSKTSANASANSSGASAEAQERPAKGKKPQSSSEQSFEAQGETRSEKSPDQNAKPENADKQERPERAERPDRADRTERPNRNARPRQSSPQNPRDKRDDKDPQRDGRNDRRGRRNNAESNANGASSPNAYPQNRDGRADERGDRRDRNRSPRDGSEARRNDFRRPNRDRQNIASPAPGNSLDFSDADAQNQYINSLDVAHVESNDYLAAQPQVFAASASAGQTSQAQISQPQTSQPGRQDAIWSPADAYEPNNSINELTGIVDDDLSTQFNDDPSDDFEPSQAAQNFASLDKEKACELVKFSLDKMVAAICSDADISVNVGEGRISASIDCGEASGLLIGREGQTLSALQYMVSRIISRQMEAAVHVHLDTGDYKERQDRKLKEISLRLAQRARETGRTQYTRPLSSYHRRIVHMVLQTEQGIETRSKGEGSMKRVYIFTRSN